MGQEDDRVLEPLICHHQKKLTVFTEIYSGPTKVLETLKLQLSKRRCDKVPFRAERTTYTL